MRKLLLTGAFAYSDAQMAELAENNDIIWMQHENGNLPAGADEAEAIVCNGLFLYHSLDEFPKLKTIQLTSAGFDRVPLDEIRERSIKIHNARGVYSKPMAEWALCSAMNHFQRRWCLRRAQAAHRWEKQRGVREISGSVVAVVGAGNIGTEVARLFHLMGARVDGFDVDVESPRPYFDNLYATDSLRSRVADYDVVVLTAPLLESTRGMIDAEVLGAMRDGSLIVNIARGGLINQDDLITVLEKRRDSLYAALDVFETEPLPADSPLWDMENVVVTPHNSFVGDGNSGRMFEVIRTNLAQL